jgi:uncharacterized cupredoxin-like copper-binding protein
VQRRAFFMKRVLHVGLLGVLSLLLLGCGSAAEANEVIIEVSEQGYLPDEVNVVVGEDARLTLRNVGTEDHDLGIVEIPLVTRGGGSTAGHNMDDMNGEMATPLQLHIVAGVGASTSLDFTPSKTGEYEFRCQIPGHSETGTLIVAMDAE